MEQLGYFLLCAGAMAWLIGTNLVARRATRRLNLRWPTLPPWSKLYRGEKFALMGVLGCAIVGYVCFALLTNS